MRETESWEARVRLTRREARVWAQLAGGNRAGLSTSGTVTDRDPPSPRSVAWKVRLVLQVHPQSCLCLMHLSVTPLCVYVRGFVCFFLSFLIVSCPDSPLTLRLADTRPDQSLHQTCRVLGPLGPLLVCLEHLSGLCGGGWWCGSSETRERVPYLQTVCLPPLPCSPRILTPGLDGSQERKSMGFLTIPGWLLAFSLI